MDDGETTARRILALLRDGPATAQALAARLGLDVSSVRRHLDTMASRAWVEHEDRPAGPGRPRRHYRLTDDGWETFPRDYALLLHAVLDAVERRQGREAALACLSDVARDLAGRVQGEKTAARLEALRSLYDELGFEASLEHDDVPVLVQRNCPFLRTARADPEALCDCLDEGILRAALPGARIELRSCMATGDALCLHAVTPADA